MDEAPAEPAGLEPAEATDGPAPAPRPSLSVHGSSVPRGLTASAASGQGRFGRIFPALAPCELDDDAIKGLLRVIENAPTLGQNPGIPSGFTYLGQFIDHDITFDPNSQLDRLNDPAALTNFRSPRLDLDSVYGSGPADQPFMYDWDRPEPGVEFLIAKRPDGESTIDDLPRNDGGRALIGDPRNDVHLIIAQLHLLFLRFHNRVVRHLREVDPRGLGGTELFAEACRLVRWHYQWIVVNDFLPRVVGEDTMNSVRQPAGAWPRIERRFYRWAREPFIPVEFSGAAYRFGHSMVRESYRLKPVPTIPEFPQVIAARKNVELFPKAGAGAAVLSEKATVGPAGGPPVGAAPNRRAEILPMGGVTTETPNLTGFRELTPRLRLEWSRFFAVDPQVRPQRSLTIDTNIAIRLSNLPSSIGAKPLPQLNLERGLALGLPSGQDVARAMGIGDPLTPAELFPKDGLRFVDERYRKQLLHSTPLWYYVLAEAASSRGRQGRQLGPVGGRIVAEVLLGLIEGDPQSYLSQAPAWVPELPAAENRGDDESPGFTMADLVRFTNSPGLSAPPLG